MEKNINNKGFSLIELLVASALFMVVVAIAAGSFISILDASRDSREFSELMTNVDFALEDMSRNIRIGEDYSIAPDGKEITMNVFKDGTVCTIYYRLQGSVIEKNKSTNPGCNGYNDYIAITSPQIEVTNLNFAGHQVNDPNKQPRIIINISGETREDSPQTFNLQTSVTQRSLNY